MIERVIPSVRLRRNSLLWWGIGIVLFFIVVTMAAPWIAPFHPTQYQDGGRLQPPSIAHLMGTDQLGRDVFSRILYGGRIPLTVAFVSAAVAMVSGAFLGWVSGYFGGFLDRTLSLTMDSLYSFPSLILAIVIAAMLGPGVTNMVVAVAVVYIPTYYRVARGQVLQLRELDMVEAARALGAGDGTILFRHIAPNTFNSIFAVSSFNIADAILTAAGLSFLGLGVPPPTPDWGFDLQSGQSFLPSGTWWPVTFPGLMILVLTLGFGMFGEGISDHVNPKR